MKPRRMDDDEPADELAIDPSALLVALVLVPHSYPRNKFFQLFRHPEAALVRRRAARLRSVIADLTGEAEALTVVVDEEGTATLSYRLEELGASRVCHLDPTELALVKHATERLRPRPELSVSEDAAERIDGLVGRLMD
jgi:hypothetical protein